VRASPAGAAGQIHHLLETFDRLRWALDDISAFVSQLRAEHRRAADTEHARLALKETVERGKIVDNIV
jgi:hypothetical protein